MTLPSPSGLGSGPWGVLVDFTPQYTSRVLEIWLEASFLAHDFVPPSLWEETLPLVRDEILPKAFTRVFLREGRPVGFLSLLEQSYIGALFVDPACQGQGVGTALLEDAMVARSLLTLSVYAQNAPSVAFYRRHGFTLLQESIESVTGCPEYLMAWKKL